MPIALIANANRYTGPDACEALAGQGCTLYGHDAAFGDEANRRAFESTFPGSRALMASEPEDAITEVLQQSSSIDILYCNQLLHPEAKPITETDPGQFREMLEALLVEPYRFIRAAIPALRKSGQGRIIVVTSAAPLRPGPTVSLYSSARAGANSLVQSLAKELGPDNIAVYGIAPNYYASEDTYSRIAFEKSDRFKASVKRNVPLQRLSNEMEMGRLVRYLALDDSAFITGQIIAFTGGWS